MTALRSAFFPIAAFATVVLAHFAWANAFPERDPAQDRWAVVESEASVSSVGRYLESEGYWLGFSYAYPAAFAASAFGRYLERRRRADQAFAVGGITASWILAAAGCFLTGCCGSPILGVYLSLFGTSILPFAKPMLAGLTFLFVTLFWIWMVRRSGMSVTISPQVGICADPNCAREASCGPSDPRP